MNQKKKFMKFAAKLLAILLVLLYLPVSAASASYETDPIHEKELVLNWDKPFVAYGDALNEEEREKTFQLLGVEKKDDYQFVEITDLDVWPLVDALFVFNYSSVVVEKGKEGSGVQVYVNTPDMITHVEDYEYSNAAITSGVTDCKIIVASCKEATGTSALAGVFKIYNLLEEGAINEEAARLSVDELQILAKIKEENGIVLRSSETSENTEVPAEETTSIVENTDASVTATEKAETFDMKKLTQAMLNAKQEIADKKVKESKTFSEEELTDTLKRVFGVQKVELSENSLKKLVDWANKFQNLEIDWQKTVKQIKSYSENKILDKSGKKYEVGGSNLIWYLLGGGGLVAVAILAVVLGVVLSKKKRNAGAGQQMR